jgi:hypothetical protein
LTEKEAEHFNGLLDIQHRRDIMHLSTCCKWMRQTLFGLSLPNQLNVTLCESDLSMVTGLMKEARDRVT